MTTTFQLQATDGLGRAGMLMTAHGPIQTPAFMPVATQGSVKTITPQELRDIGVTIVLGNAYHLFLRPGIDTIRDMGGVSAFMSWGGPMLTDSGGFQAYSLGRRVNINELGIEFQSHIDGSYHMFTPENVMAYQGAMGADIAMTLDHCLGYTDDKETVRDAMHRTNRWAERCVRAGFSGGQSMFGIVQGGVFPDLREESASFITNLELPGYAIGGLGVGESKSGMYQLVTHTASLLPSVLPRYLMGIGSPEDLVECVGRGVDMFDCVLPTRVARNGAMFTRFGRVNIANARFRGVDSSIDKRCDCYSCCNFSMGYMHHLFRARELLGLRLATIHNLRFLVRLMEDIRKAVIEGTFQTFAEAFLERYQPADENARMKQRQKWRPSRPRTL